MLPLQVKGISLLDIHALSLQRLRSLGLVGLKLQSLPNSLTSTLKQLTELNLSCNEFIKMPEAISHITALQTIDLSGNGKLRLEQSDADTLASLPHLLSLRLKREDSNKNGWLNRDLGILLTMAKRLPNLELPGLV